MGTVSIHFSHLQLASNPQMHIKPHFLFKLIGFAGVWHWIVILCFGGFSNVTTVLHSPVTAEVHKDSKSKGSTELLSCVQVGRALAEALHSPQAGADLRLRCSTVHFPAEHLIKLCSSAPSCTSKTEVQEPVLANTTCRKQRASQLSTQVT